MKKLFKSIRSSFLLTFFICFSTWASSPLALVNSVKGNAFVMKQDGTTKTLSPGDHLYDFDEIVTETGGQISFSDYYDHQYHLSGSGQLKVLNKMVELKRGYLWQQSYKDGEEYITQTANAVVKYMGGESIVSFDPFSGKTQLLVIKGDFELSNLVQKFLKLNVREGQFSFIDNEYEQGRPRNPTPLGYNSFRKVTSLFKGVSPLEKQKAYDKLKTRPTMELARARGIASVKNEKKKEGEIIYLTRDRNTIKERQQALLLDYEKKISKMSKPKKKAFKPSYAKKSAANVKVFGGKFLKKTVTPKNIAKKTTKKVEIEPKRVPASVSSKNHSNVGKKKKEKASGFEKSLMDAYKNQMRHSDETNELIKDLKNYKQDYKTSY